MSFVVVDFETTTPRGYPPEPIDVAILALRVDAGQMVERGRFTALIQPPAHAPITPFDTTQTGITAAMVAGAPSADAVLARLDARFTDPPYLLVAHNAPTEAGVLYNYRDHCPRLATTDLLDTVRLARVIHPQLRSHSLDALLHDLDLPAPSGRHRAMPDVETTAALFRHLLERGASTGRWRTLRQLRADGGCPARASQPQQDALF